MTLEAQRFALWILGATGGITAIVSALLLNIVNDKISVQKDRTARDRIDPGAELNRSVAQTVVVAAPNARLNLTGRDNVTINQGASETDTRRIFREEFERAMKQKKSEGSADLSREFPFGYTLFTLAATKQEIAFLEPTGKAIAIDWKMARYELTASSIRLVLPQMILNAGTVVAGCAIELPRQTGANLTLDLEPERIALVRGNRFLGGPGPMEHRVALGLHPTISLTIRHVVTDGGGDMMLLGLGPYIRRDL